MFLHCFIVTKYVCRLVYNQSEHSQLRKWELDEIRSAKKIDALIFHSETDGEVDYQSDSRYLKWMADIPGAKWIELPNHNSEDGKEIIIDGKQCKIKKRMRGGWKIKHNQDLGHKKKAWTVVNPEEKKEMLKKAMLAGKSINAKVIGVSILTSLKESDALTLFSNSIHDQITNLFNLAKKVGLVVPMNTFHLFVPFLCIDCHGGNRSGFKPCQADRLVSFFTKTI